MVQMVPGWRIVPACMPVAHFAAAHAPGAHMSVAHAPLACVTAALVATYVVDHPNIAFAWDLVQEMAC